MFEIWMRVNNTTGLFRSDYLNIRLANEPSCATFAQAQFRCKELNNDYPGGSLEFYVKEPEAYPKEALNQKRGAFTLPFLIVR